MTNFVAECRDRATFDPSSQNPVTYTVSSPEAAPASLTYGPSFMSIASSLNGSVILGIILPSFELYWLRYIY